MPPAVMKATCHGALTCQQPEVLPACVARSACELLQAARLPPAAGAPIHPRHLCTRHHEGITSRP